MFGRDAVTNLSQLTKPKLGYMGTEDLIPGPQINV